MRGENLIWWLIVERFAKVRNKVLKNKQLHFLKGGSSFKKKNRFTFVRLKMYLFHFFFFIYIFFKSFKKKINLYGIQGIYV